MEGLRERREERGYTQQRLAAAVGVTQTAISLIESGERKPSVKVARRLGNLLDFDWTELFDDQPTDAAEE